MTNCLADPGHRNIAFFGGIAVGPARKERIAGYVQVLNERRLREPIVWDPADTRLSGPDAVLALRTAHPEVTALVCNGDWLHRGLALRCIRLGLQAGMDLSVICFVDIAAATVATLPLTTPAANPSMPGQRVARVLIDRFPEPRMPQVTVTVPAQRIVRKTNGPVAVPRPQTQRP